jgi:NAD(P)-dependent dehydrogenase (short-subunit alcohol dehydrogenase family)
MKIAGKVAIVTGGASGLGEGTARRLLADGAKVAIFDRDAGKGEALTAQFSGKAKFFNVDVSDEASVTAAVEGTKAAFGAIHILVNCAGVGIAGRTFGKKGPLPLADFKRIIDINLVGTFNVIRLATHEMSKNEADAETGEKGVVVNTSSIAAFEGQMGQVAYSASKAGVLGMTLPLVRDLSSHGIRVNAIAPGLFETPMAAGIPEEVKKELTAGFEFPKRIGQPSEFAALVAFMVENSYLNGDVVRLDAGTRPPPR